jgi:hypothetical protein
MAVPLSADFSAPLVLPGCSSAPGTTPTESLSEEHLATIVSMGFSRDQASKALREKPRAGWRKRFTPGSPLCYFLFQTIEKTLPSSSYKNIHEMPLQLFEVCFFFRGKGRVKSDI